MAPDHIRNELMKNAGANKCFDPFSQYTDAVSRVKFCSADTLYPASPAMTNQSYNAQATSNEHPLEIDKVGRKATSFYACFI